MPDLSSVSVKHSRSSSAPVRVVIIGDSITENLTYCAWFESVVFASCGTIKKVKNAGKGGDTTQQMIDRFSTDVVAYASDEIWVQCGTNDLGVLTAQQYKTKLKELLTLAIATGRIVRLFSIPPRNSHASSVASFRLVQSTVSRELDVFFYDLWDDCFSSSGEYATLHTVDGIHPVSLASTKAFAKASAMLLTQNISHNITLPNKNESGSGLLSNPLFILDTNADGLADGCLSFGTGSPTYSLVSGSFGNKQRITKTAGNSTAGVWIGRVVATIGNEYLVKLKASVSMTAMLFRISVICLNDWTEVETKYIHNFTSSSSGEVEYRFTQPSGCTHFVVSISCLPVDASSLCTIDLERTQIYNLTSLGLA